MRIINTLIGSLGLVTALTAAGTAPAHASIDPTAEKEWTILVFLNGHNNLDSFGAMDINEMEKVGSTDKVNVVVQWASSDNPDTRRLLVQKDSDPSRVSSPVVESLPRVDMGDARNLVSFIEWGVKNYPAKHYMVDVWDHGSGWHKIQGGMQTRDISWDDHTNHFITTEQLGDAMRSASRIIGKKVDLYGSDACLMAMAEVAGQMTDSVEVFAGSEEVEPGEGWPYDAFLTRLTGNPSATAAEASKILAETYFASYQGGSQGRRDVTFSSFDLSKTSTLEAAMTQLSGRMRTLPVADRKRVVTAARDAMSFTYSDYVDLADFTKRLQALRIEALDVRALGDVREAIGSYVITALNSTSYAGAGGVAVWAPSSKYTYTSHAQRYRGLEFAKNTNWADALQYLLQDL